VAHFASSEAEFEEPRESKGALEIRACSSSSLETEQHWVISGGGALNPKTAAVGGIVSTQEDEGVERSEAFSCLLRLMHIWQLL